MAKQLNVSLAFTANTNEAIAAIKNLQKELNSLATGKSLQNSGISQITPEIQRAMVAAGELQAKLESATNLKTGKLDISQFSESLRKGKTSLQEYANQLNALGPAGRQAFTNLAQSIIQAEAPLIRCNSKLKELGTTLANTARWQLSSSILHGFMGTVSSAYRYAQDLNESLNNIRIVTGQNTDQMAKFAAQANKAAKALSTTTTEYTDASLIYYQQGLSDAEVAKRTEVTIKMANAAGQSAEQVSDQLTAIWNNFYDGSKSLEYYADVMTALGAATASSTEEIAGGLEKFAAVADTIGLSYEYAASALATITSNTRQSEDVVGTALRTIFARIQGLNLGDTLEDGTTLNKYSIALQKVGINIFEANGQIKQMDSILDEMAEKWGTLAKDQQIALAQTVAGVRQYNQLVALMDNWNSGDSDSMVANLETAQNSTGELQKQADIYAESWEAARDRVTASAEAIYSKILDDDFFIDFLDGLSTVIDGIGNLIDAFGGLKGVLATVGAFATKIFHQQIAQGLRNTVQNFKQFTPIGKKEQDQTKDDAIKGLQQLRSNLPGYEGQAENAAMEREMRMQTKLRAAAKSVTDEELKQLQIQMDQVRVMDQRAIAAAKAADAVREEIEDARDLARAYEQMDARDKAKAKWKEERTQDLINRGKGQKNTDDGFEEYDGYLKKKYNEAQKKAQRKKGSTKKAFIESTFMSSIENDAKNTNSEDSAIANNLLKEITAAGEKGAENVKNSLEEAMTKAAQEAGKKFDQATDILDTGVMTETRAQDLRETASSLSLSGPDANKNKDILKKKLSDTISEAEKLNKELGEDSKKTANLQKFIKELQNMESQLENNAIEAKELDDILERLGSEDVDSITLGLEEESRQFAIDAAGYPYGGETSDDAQTRGGQDYLRVKKGAKETIRKENAEAAVKQSEKDLDKSFDSTNIQDWADQLANTTNIIMDLGSAITSVQGIIDVFNNPDSSGWDKIMAIISGVVGIMPLVTSSFQILGTTAAVTGQTIGASLRAAFGPISLIVVAITALIAAFSFLSDAIHNASPAGQFEEASKAAESAADAAEQVKAQYDALKSSLDQLDSGIEAIHEMERGTLEWRSAIIESNSALIELLSTYGMLNSKNFTTDADGLMQITDEAKEKLLKEQQATVERAETTSYLSQINKNNAELNLKVSKSGSDSDVQQAIALAMQNGTITDLNNSEQLLAVVETIDRFTAEEAKNVADGIAADYALQKSILDLNGSMIATTESNKVLWGQIVDGHFGDVIDEATAGMSDAERQQVQNFIGKELEAQVNDLTGVGGLYDPSSAEIQRLYAEAMGYSTIVIEETDDGQAKYYAKDGITEIGVYSDEDAARYLAEQEAVKQMSGDIQTYIDTVQKLANLGNTVSDNAGQAMTTFAGGTGGSFNNLTAAEVEAIKKAFRYNANSELTFNGQIIDDDYANKIGYADAEAYYNAIQNALKAYDFKETNLLDNFSLLVSSAINKQSFKNLNLDTKEQIGNALQDAYNLQGFNAMDSLIQVFEYAGEDADKLSQIVAGIDWTSNGAIEDLNSALQEQNINVNELGPNWNNYVRLMKDAANTVPDLKALGKTINEINNVSKNIDLGSILTKEDYETLINYNSALSEYFTILADGSAQFTGDKLDFQQDITKTNKAELEKAIKEHQNRINELNEQYKLGGQAVSGNVDKYRDANKDNVKTQLDFLRSQGYDQEQIANWQVELTTGGTSVDTLNEIAAAVDNTANSFEQLPKEAYEAQVIVQDSMNQLALSAEDADERLALLEDETINSAAYATAVQAAHNQEKWEGLEPDEVENYADHLMEAAEASEILSDELKNNEEAAEDVALYTKKMNQGIEKLSEGFDEWNDILRESDKSSEEYSDAMSNMKDATSDLLGTSEDFIKDKFILDHLEDIEKAADGDAEAIDKLRIALSKDIICQILAVNNFDEVNTQIQHLSNIITELDSTIEIGATLKTDDFTAAAQNLINAAGMTVEQAQAYFNSLGYEPTFVMQNETRTAPMYGKRVYTDDVVVGEAPYGEGSYPYIKSMVTREEQVYMGEQEQNFIVPAMSGNGKTPKIYSLTKTSSGKMNNYSSKNSGGSSSGGGGGGSQPKKAEKANKSDVVERYKEINDKLDDVADAMDDASKAADRLYGLNRLKEMQKVNNLIQDEIDLTKQKKKEALDYLKIDQQALIEAGNAAGASFIFDGVGNIANYTEQMTKLYNELAAAIDSANADGGADEAEQETIDAIQERVDKVKEAIDQYDETRELIEDLDNEIDDKFNEWQDNNAEMLNYKLELKLEINDMELEKIEYYLNKMKDDFYQMAEAGALMLGNLNPDSTGENGQLGTYLQELADYKDQFDALIESRQKNKISQDAYIEGLKEVRSGIFENLEALQELDKTMLDYYGDTIAMAQDELAKYTDQMEHQNEVLEHYASILELIGKSNDYKALDIVLQGQLKTAENRAKVAKKDMEMYKDQAEARYAEYQQALAAGDEAAAELYLKQYEAALEAANEAEEEYLSDVEEWGDKIRAVLENTMKDLGQTLENALTGGTSFDQLTESLDRAKSLQEEYLTTTNKIYETNKLMRTAQQAIDKSTNNIAKQRLKGFIDETQQLQDQSKLSQYELEIQQAKYNLLLAEIALEEAQDAKSIVRLQRDSEGNFGYVYTADQAAVGEAEQQLLDAQNDLYNISLRGANDYTEKYQQTLSEMYDTLTDIQQQYLDGAFESEEEYNAAVEAAKAYYYEKLKDYSNLYTVAITTDNRVVADAWSTDFAEMTGNTDEWAAAVDGYIDQIKQAFREYEEQMDVLTTESVGPDLDELADKTHGITEANDELVEKITNPENGVIKSLEDELIAVANLTGKYAILRDMLKDVIGEYEGLTNKLDAETEKTLNGDEDSTNILSEPVESETLENPALAAPSETPNVEVGGRVTVKRSASRFASGEYMDGWVPGTSFEVFRVNGDTVLIGDRNRAGIYTGWVNKTDLEGFDTGGYTGDWAGAYGKLAMLHKKELILNENDTDNFLTGMNIMERILQMIDLQSMSAQLGGFLSTPSLGISKDNILEQNVHIEANFPNATDHSEIEEAFGNLINLASQYANRK